MAQLHRRLLALERRVPELYAMADSANITALVAATCCHLNEVEANEVHYAFI